jgi:prolipoprotein diacylglyceryltransferase
LFFIYIIGYSVSQIIVFTWRDNDVIFMGLKQAQLTAIGVIIAAMIIFMAVFIRQKRMKRST